MSGTGKSTVIRELAVLGYKAVDADYEDLSEWVNVAGDSELAGSIAEQEWMWREDRMQRLLSAEGEGVLFVSGCARNQVKFYPQFEHIVLLSAPAEVIIERLTTRTNNPYGRHPDELAQVLRHQQTVEPLLRQAASLELDTSAPLDQVVKTILGVVLPAAPS